MAKSALEHPLTDPTPIFEHFRGSCGSELLTAAIAHFDVFGRLHREPASLETMQTELGLARRPAIVLTTVLRAMGFLDCREGKLFLTPLAEEHLVPGAPFDCGDYVGLSAQSPGVLGMVKLLKENKPLGSDDEGGAAFIFRDGIASAMEAEATARHFTLALAGRAKNVAPALANVAPLPQGSRLLDVGGGTGIYSFALLQKNPSCSAVVWDRPEVLKVAQQMAEEYGLLDRVEFIAGDMFADPFPEHIDAVLLSNILHDWDEADCLRLLKRCADALPSNGRLFIHDVFLDDDLAGPLPIALYSASLFSFTEGRAYSAAEYSAWLAECGLEASRPEPTLVHCGVMTGLKKTN